MVGIAITSSSSVAKDVSIHNNEQDKYTFIWYAQCFDYVKEKNTLCYFI